MGARWAPLWRTPRQELNVNFTLRIKAARQHSTLLTDPPPPTNSSVLVVPLWIKKKLLQPRGSAPESWIAISLYAAYDYAVAILVWIIKQDFWSFSFCALNNLVVQNITVLSISNFTNDRNIQQRVEWNDCNESLQTLLTPPIHTNRHTHSEWIPLPRPNNKFGVSFWIRPC